MNGTHSDSVHVLTQSQAPQEQEDCKGRGVDMSV